MARPRKPPNRPRVPARDHHQAYLARQARVRRLGFSSYWKFRRARTGDLLRFLRSLKEGDLITMPYGLSSVQRDSDGRYLEIVKTTLDGRTGAERWWTLTNLTRRQLELTIGEEQERGAIFSPAPSLDQRRLLAADEVEGGYGDEPFGSDGEV